MSTSSNPTRKLPKRTLLFIAPQNAWADFAVLLDAYREQEIDVKPLLYERFTPNAVIEAGSLTDLDAVLLAGPARYAPSTVLPAPFLPNGSGRIIPAAWLPIKHSVSNRRFAAVAARVHQRSRQLTTVALLGQRHPRYLHLADRLETLLDTTVHLFRWTGEVIGQAELVDALGTGLGLALYVGHGRPIGWAGYYGLRSRHFDNFAGEPLGGVLSLCCRTASRRHTSLSYAESLPLMGVTAASFGATADTRHTDNTRWAIRICDTLAAGVTSIGELIVRSAPPQPSASASYRLIGDPLAPLNAEAVGATRAAAIQTYP